MSEEQATKPTTQQDGSSLSHGMTEQEKTIFYRLLIDLFIDNPKRKYLHTPEGTGTNEKISTEQTRK